MGKWLEIGELQTKVRDPHSGVEGNRDWPPLRFLHLWWMETPHLDLGLFLESWPGHALHDGSSWPPPPGDWLLALQLQLDLLQSVLSLGELW